MVQLQMEKDLFLPNYQNFKIKEIITIVMENILMFDKYEGLIKELDSFEKENILSKKFELYSDNKDLLCTA